MSRADDIRAAAEAAAKVAELEDELVAAKDNEAVTAELKHELRYARWVLRGGPADEEAALAAEDGGHTNKSVAGFYTRWLTEQGG